MPRPDLACRGRLRYRLVKVRAGFGRIVWLMCLVLSFGLSPDAWAEKPRDKARREFTAGRNAFDAGDYEMAIRKFLLAEKSAPSPILTYNIGLAYERLGRDGDAALAFERCIEELLAAPKMDRRLYGDAKQHVADARARDARRKPAVPRPGAFEFRGTPGGHIVVDGAPRGDVPARVELAPGNHVIEIRKAGFVSYQSRLPLAEGESRVVTVELEPERPRSTIRVEAAPVAPSRVEPEPTSATAPAPAASTIKVESAAGKN